MKLRTKLAISVAAALTLVTLWSCGGKNPAESSTVADGKDSASAAGAESDSVAEQALVRMTWRMTDRCNDGRGLQWKLFDKTNNRTKFPTTGVYKVGSGGSSAKVISCEARHKLCFGGTTNPPTPAFFGVGIKGNQGCSRCCTACRPASVGVTISCGRGLAEGEELLGVFEEEEGQDVDL